MTPFAASTMSLSAFRIQFDYGEHVGTSARYCGAPHSRLLETAYRRRSMPLLVVEVADTSLAHDRYTKAPLYARAGIPEYWIVDLNGERIEVYREPSTAGYRTIRFFLRGESLTPAVRAGHGHRGRRHPRPSTHAGNEWLGRSAPVGADSVRPPGVIAPVRGELAGSAEPGIVDPVRASRRRPSRARRHAPGSRSGSRARWRTPRQAAPAAPPTT